MFPCEFGSTSYRDFAKNIALMGAKKWGPTCDHDISNSAIYTTAIYRAYTVLIYSTDTLEDHFTVCIIASVVTLKNMGEQSDKWTNDVHINKKKIHSTTNLNLMSWHGNSLCITGLLCGGSTSHWWIPLSKVSNAQIYVFFVLSLNKLLNKQFSCWLFETPWRSCYITVTIH